MICVTVKYSREVVVYSNTIYAVVNKKDSTRETFESRGALLPMTQNNASQFSYYYNLHREGSSIHQERKTFFKSLVTGLVVETHVTGVLRVTRVWKMGGVDEV